MATSLVSPRRDLRRSAALLLCAHQSSAVTIDLVKIVNPFEIPNAGETSGDDGDSGPAATVGGVGYRYAIALHEVTNSQYVEFLNAKATLSDPLGLYNPSMSSDGQGGIDRTGTGPYVYSVQSGEGNRPVNFVSFYDGLRFANWLENGQGSGDTETGTYNLDGGTAVPSNADTISRVDGNYRYAIPTESEWYKAAYYNPYTTSYFDYGTSSDTPPRERAT